MRRPRARVQIGAYDPIEVFCGAFVLGLATGVIVTLIIVGFTAEVSKGGRVTKIEEIKIVLDRVKHDLGTAEKKLIGLSIEREAMQTEIKALRELVSDVVAMRRAQIEYYRKRGDAQLIAAKEAERKADLRLKHVNQMTIMLPDESRV